MSIIDLIHPDGRLIVGVGTDADGSLRVYLGMRSTGLHAHVDGEDAKAEVLRAWHGTYGHLTTRVPASALCRCPESDAIEGINGGAS